MNEERRKLSERKRDGGKGNQYTFLELFLRFSLNFSKTAKPFQTNFKCKTPTYIKICAYLQFIVLGTHGLELCQIFLNKFMFSASL